MRPDGIPDDVCTSIENAMALDPAKRPASAAEFGRELQAAQRRNGLKPDSMAITSVTGDTRDGRRYADGSAAEAGFPGTRLDPPDQARYPQ